MTEEMKQQVRDFMAKLTQSMLDAEDVGISVSHGIFYDYPDDHYGMVAVATYTGESAFTVHFRPKQPTTLRDFKQCPHCRSVTRSFGGRCV